MVKDKNTLIVSMTSWPKRIKYCSRVFFSIMESDCPKDKYHLVLVLCEKEFPNKEADLPEVLRLMIKAGDIELIWHPTNIFSHKKLMPVLKKYPDNPILVCDDDIIRPKHWLPTFLKDHAEHPDEIIVGGCVFDISFDGNVLNPVKRFRFDPPSCAGKIVKGARPANGFGGVLYPAHTFTDPRFFDEKLFMELSAYSDESWQYCFSIMYNKTMRWLSVHIPHQHGQQEGTYDCSMSKLRKPKDSYVNIYNKLLNYFPEFKANMKNYV